MGLYLTPKDSSCHPTPTGLGDGEPWNFVKSMLHSNFLSQSLLPAVLAPGAREQAGHCAQALRSVATASGRPLLGA